MAFPHPAVTLDHFLSGLAVGFILLRLAQVQGNTGDCSTEMLNKTCLRSFLEEFDINGTTLPDRNGSSFSLILDDAFHLCSSFNELRKCLGGFYEKCFDYDTILDLSDNKKDALQYTREMEKIEFDCDNNMDYDDNDNEALQCVHNVIESRFYDEFNNCSDYKNGTCVSMARKTECETKAVQQNCKNYLSVHFYCKYNAIHLRMNGFRLCAKMPCGAASTLVSLFCFSCIIYQLKC
ncbi:hypothetical protein ANCCAN_17969 [Ancylostoma caninum]|uniref:Chondroitin proteoglycan 4 domain-containing protein n=1 Tax=Ancylostoma caninum TaxID=29170 RepID=A0A368G0P2_ANCCA|nr:hypothetical protein ANCCAN_17969 [Ancylostoma caninum]